AFVRAKLLLREGRIDESMEALGQAARAFPPSEDWFVYPGSEGNPLDCVSPHARISGELAALKLARGQYVQSLDLLMRNGWWSDAAYIAERVVTTDELK